MSGRQGGKLKPLKAPKKAKVQDISEEDKEVEKAAKVQQAKEKKEAGELLKRAKIGGPLGAGLKKSGKK